LGADAPDWAKRIELEWGFDAINKPTYSILTVQPLYQDKDKTNTIFMQGSQLRYSLFGDYRDTTNIGIGYRRLFLDDKLLAGINAFYDHEWTFGHRRASIGGEIKLASLDINANHYMGLSGEKSVSSDLSEEVLDGSDVEIRSQVPFMPWANIGAKRYIWKSINNEDDISGWTFSAEADVVQNISIEVGTNDDNFQDTEGFLKLRFHAAREDIPTMFSSAFWDKQMFRMRDMKAHTLDKVRRQNKIIVERKARGVVISRGN
jgi:hypothetical protein